MVQHYKKRKLIGYLCPNCEQTVPGRPLVFEEDGDITFYCDRCKETWVNTRNILQFNFILVDVEESK